MEAMEQLISEQIGKPGALTTILGVMLFHVAVQCSKIVYDLFTGWRQRAAISEQSIRDLTVAVKENTKQIQNLQVLVEKSQLDLRKAFIGLKFISKDEWPNVRKAIDTELKINLPGEL